MNRIWIVPAVVVLASLGVWLAFFRGGGGEPEIEFRYEPVKRGELIRSISATGQVVALTSVDVKSKAGGIVEKLAVDEGSAVKKGDLIAIIDPRDTRALYEQASADVRQAQARAGQAESTFKLQVATSKTSVEDAKAALETARIRLAKSEVEAARQPTMSSASLNSAQAAHDSAKEDLQRFLRVTEPQLRRDAAGNYDKALAERDAAKADYERQQELLRLGYVSQATVERARAAHEAAQAAYNTAKVRLDNVERDIAAQKRSFELAVDRAFASLQEARAGKSQDEIAKQNLAEAKKAVTQAEIALQRALDARMSNEIRRDEMLAAKAGTVRSQVSLDNAKVQLDSTTVVAPRDGVVTMKYLEEGTIIPPGTSTFAQGTSIVQLSDVTRLFVDCAVDEADIADVREGQKVRIVTEAYPGETLNGVVTRVNPAARTEQNITAIKVRVQVLPGYTINLLPGMNASVEFITLSKKNILVTPAQAIERDGDKAYIRVRGKDPLKPERRAVKTGAVGNNGVEIVEGLKEGEEVVTAEINLRELRETQEKMLEAMQGGGLAGGGPMGGRRTTTSRTGSRGGQTGGGSGGAGARAGQGGQGGGGR